MSTATVTPVVRKSPPVTLASKSTKASLTPVVRQTLRKVENVHFRVYSNNDTPSPRGGVTVTYIPLPGSKHYLGVSVCSLNDNFDRTIGRMYSGADALESNEPSNGLLTRQELVARATFLARAAWNSTSNGRKVNFDDGIRLYSKAR